MSDLKQAMKASGVTQYDLAEQLGVTQASVSMWANGRSTIPPARHAALLEIVGYVPEAGTGTETYDGALDDLDTFLRQGPLGYLVLQALPKGVTVPWPAPEDVNLWKLGAWATIFGVGVGVLVRQIAGEVPISHEQLQLVADQGVKFDALEDLVRTSSGMETVSQWLRASGPFASFKALRNAAAVRMLEDKAAYDGLRTVMWEQDAFDMDQLWAQAQELEAE